MRFSLVFLCLTACVFAAPAAVRRLLKTAVDKTPCIFQMQNPKVTFDLTPLVSDQPWAWFQDDAVDVAGETRDYYYYFNLCQNLPAPPPTVPQGLCANKTGPLGSTVAAAYQVINDTTVSGGRDIACKAVGYASNITWKLIDSTNPTLGVIQNIGGGESCGNNGVRDLSVTLACDKNAQEFVFGKVNEANTCDYEVTISSIYACPKECPVVNGYVCGKHGLCGWDRDVNAVRCFCNQGFEGTDCQTVSTPASSPSSTSSVTTVLTVFVIILVVALLAMATILYRKIKKLQADDGRYASLQAGPEESGERRPNVPADNAPPPSINDRTNAPSSDSL